MAEASKIWLTRGDRKDRAVFLTTVELRFVRQCLMDKVNKDRETIKSALKKDRERPVFFSLNRCIAKQFGFKNIVKNITKNELKIEDDRWKMINKKYNINGRR